MCFWWGDFTEGGLFVLGGAVAGVAGMCCVWMLPGVGRVMRGRAALCRAVPRCAVRCGARGGGTGFSQLR